MTTTTVPYRWQGFVRAPFSNLVACEMQGGRDGEYLVREQNPERFDVLVNDEQAQSAMRGIGFAKDVSIVLSRIRADIAQIREARDFAEAPVAELEFDVKDLIYVIDRLHGDLASVVSRALPSQTKFHKLPSQLPAGSALRLALERDAAELRAHRDMRNDLEHFFSKPKEGQDVARFPELGKLLMGALRQRTFRSTALEEFISSTTARAFTLAVLAEDHVRAFLVEEFGSKFWWPEIPATISAREDGVGTGLVIARRHLDALEATLRANEEVAHVE